MHACVLWLRVTFLYLHPHIITPCISRIVYHNTDTLHVQRLCRPCQCMPCQQDVPAGAVISWNACELWVFSLEGAANIATAGFHEWQFCALHWHWQSYHMPVIYNIFMPDAHKLLTAFVCSMHRSLLQTTKKTYKHSTHLSDVLWGSTKYFCTSCSSAGAALATSCAAKACVVAALRLPKTISATKMHLWMHTQGDPYLLQKISYHLLQHKARWVASEP